MNYLQVAKVVSDIIESGSLAMDNEEDCRDLAQQFANGLELTGLERELFATRAGFAEADEMDIPREVDDT